ncbi:MAG: GGDEF domain-containing protein [Treponema sp.]|nr:GGDEF domain-containing protein [Treponema sp.]
MPAMPKEMNERKVAVTADDKISGINITLLTTFFIAITAIVFLFILFISNSVLRRFDAVEDAISKFIICEQSSKAIKDSANFMTERARLFVVNGDPAYAAAYLEEKNVTRRRMRAFDDLRTVCSVNDLAYQRLQIAIEQSESLINIEMYAIRLGYEAMKSRITDMPEEIRQMEIRSADQKLTPEEMEDAAINMLFGEGYLIYKTRVNENCNLTVTSIEDEIQRDLRINSANLGSYLQRLRFLFFVLLIITALIFFAIAYFVLHPLKNFLNSIKKDEKLNVIGSTEFKYLAKTYNQIYEVKAKNEKKLIIKAEYDALTGILNRRAFDDICRNSAEEKQPIVLLLIDMDNFKYINDTYGHAGGDTALKELARILKSTFRKSDYVARIGGDEFAAVLPDYKALTGDIVVQKIASVNEQLANMKDGIKPVSVSVGAAFSPTGYSEELYKKADKALYKTKEQGKRGCHFYEEGVD